MTSDRAMRLASSPISLVQRLDPSRRLRLDARQVINLSVLLLSVIVVVLVARTGWRSVEEYRQARQVERVNAVANDFMAAAEYRELERTYAGALLAGTHSPLDERQRLIYARRQGDLIWGRAMDGARALAVYSRCDPICSQGYPLPSLPLTPCARYASGSTPASMDSRASCTTTPGNARRLGRLRIPAQRATRCT